MSDVEKPALGTGKVRRVLKWMVLAALVLALLHVLGVFRKILFLATFCAVASQAQSHTTWFMNNELNQKIAGLSHGWSDPDRVFDITVLFSKHTPRHELSGQLRTAGYICQGPDDPEDGATPLQCQGWTNVQSTQSTGSDLCNYMQYVDAAFQPDQTLRSVTVSRRPHCD